MNEQISKHREICRWVRFPTQDAMDGSALAYEVSCKPQEAWYYNTEAKGWTFCPHCGRRIVFDECSRK